MNVGQTTIFITTIITIFNDITTTVFIIYTNNIPPSLPSNNPDLDSKEGTKYRLCKINKIYVMNK